MASDPPAHTRGFLFADLRGYSAFTERHGDQAARELLTSYRQSVREVIGKFDGAEIRTEGDSFYVVFDSVSQAVRAGLAILAAVAEPSADAEPHPVLVGIGIHAGEAEDSAEGIVSSAVNVAARICAQADPGELLVSDTVRALTRSYLEVSFLPRGRRRLKGIAEPLALYRVVAGRTAGKAAEHNGVRSALSGRWQRAGVAAVAAAGVLAIAIIGGTVMREGVAHEAATSSTSASAAIGLASPSGSDVAPSASLAPFPTDAELALLKAVDESSRERCSRPAEGPAYVAQQIGGFKPIKVAFLAGIDCALGGISAPDSFRMWQLRSTEGALGPDWEHLRIAPSALVVQKADRNAAARTSCAQEIPAREEWSFADSSGLLTCYETTTGDAILWWTYDGTDIVATAVRDDSDMAALLSWWTAEARFAP